MVIEMGNDTETLVHRLHIEVLKMHNARKQNLTAAEYAKLDLIHDTLEQLLLCLNDGAFETEGD
jgi:hypothetical protein